MRGISKNHHPLHILESLSDRRAVEAEAAQERNKGGDDRGENRGDTIDVVDDGSEKVTDKTTKHITRSVLIVSLNNKD